MSLVCFLFDSVLDKELMFPEAFLGDGHPLSLFLFVFFSFLFFFFLPSNLLFWAGKKKKLSFQTETFS